MYPYSYSSRKHLHTCDQRLVDVFMRVAEVVDTTIIEGHRGERRQNRLYELKKTQVKYPDSDHNKVPSKAVDAIPYPPDWSDRERMTLFAGIVIGIGHMMGIKIGWGGDWNRDFRVQDNKFDDLTHFFIIEDDE